jgi:small subunit ribosomal protein S8
MVVQHDISDFVSIVNLGVIRRRVYVDVKNSKKIAKIVQMLYYDGYISSYIHIGNVIRVHLKYFEGESVIQEIKVISKPSNRIYYTYKMFERFKRFGKYIYLSCTEGILCNNTLLFIEKKKGGEALFQIR